MPGRRIPFRDRLRRITRRKASVCLLALCPVGSCSWSTDPADVTPLDVDKIQVASIDQVLATADRAVQLVPDETLKLHFTPSLPVVELDGSPATYRLLVFHSAAETRYRIEVRSLPILIDPPTSGFVVPRIALYRADGSRLQTEARYELVGPGLWEGASLTLRASGISGDGGTVYVLLGTATERIGEELWLLENPMEPGRSIVDWSEEFSTSLCTLAGDLRVHLELPAIPDPGTGPGPGDSR